MQQVMACLEAEQGEGLDALGEDLTVENYSMIEGEILKTALASGKDKVSTKEDLNCKQLCLYNS